MHLYSLIDAYALRQDGSKPLTANWDAGPYKITARQVESDVAIGTAPLVITSTTLVANLNADYWDGYQFADYLNQAVKTSSSPTFVTGTFTDIVVDTNLIKTNSANNCVGINVTSPTRTIDLLGDVHFQGPAGTVGDAPTAFQFYGGDGIATYNGGPIYIYAGGGGEGTAGTAGGDGANLVLSGGGAGSDEGGGAGTAGLVDVITDLDMNANTLKTGGEIVFTESNVEIGGFATSALYCEQGTDDRSFVIDFFTAKGDAGEGTEGDSCYFQIFARGTRAQLTNTTQLAVGYSASLEAMLVASLAGGTGSVRDIHIYTGANAGQCILLATGDNTMSGNLTVASFKAGGATHYTEIKTDGEINLHGTARVTNALWIGANGVKAPPTKPAAFVDHGISGAWEFSDATDDTIVANMRVPNRMDKTVAPSISLGWSSTTLSAFCEWQIEYLWRSANEDTTAAADDTLLSSTDADASTSSGTAEGMVLSTFPLVAPSATDVCLHLRIKRRGDLAADTINGDTVELHGICLSFTSNRLGTAT